jgi:uncharacterized protein YjaZ
MTVTMIDTSAGMERVLRAPVAERPALLRDLLAPTAGMFRWFPGEVDLAAMHAAAMGFPLDGGAEMDERLLAALGRLRDADAWTRTAHALGAGAAALREAVPGVVVPDVVVSLVLGDPRDEYFMRDALGSSGNGSATGFLSLVVWPTDENLARFEAAAVHELHHNARYAPGGVVWDPAVVAVGEHVVSEGLADAFARQLHGDLGPTPMGAAAADDDAALAKVASGLEVQGMQHFTAWVHGDVAARRHGAEPVGLPSGAGYAAGLRLVDAYLEATGRTAAEALHAPSREIIAIARERLELR